jgi:hypothetical protein
MESKKIGRPKGSHMTPTEKGIAKKLRKLDEEVQTSKTALATSKTLALIRLVEDMVLLGESAKEIRENLMVKGHTISVQKTYRIMDIAKRNIKARFDKDLETNYQWCVENLMDLHKKAVLDDDGRLRLMAIDKFMQLAGLNVQRVETIQLSVTPEQIAEYEKSLFG